MAYDTKLIAGKLRRWEKYLLAYRLPAWDTIPDIGLYMEQVIDLLKGYLDYMPPELKEEQIITGAAINNYVRRGYLPMPVKKRYYRIHIAHLIMICTLKQSLSISMIRQMLPAADDEALVRRAYESYAARHAMTTTYFASEIRKLSATLLDHDDVPETAVSSPEELIAFSAILAGFSRLFAEKLLLLDGKDLKTGGSIEVN